jgi:signal peptidase I
VEPQRPRPWIAFLLGVGNPGLGHFYAGSLRGAAAALVIFIAGCVLAIWLIGTPFGVAWPIAIGLLLVLLVLVGPAIHAARVARGATHWIESRWKRTVACMAYAVVVGWVLDTPLEPWFRPPKGFQVTSASMYPTLLVGDRVIASRPAEPLRDLRRGAIVAFRMALDGDRLLPMDQAPEGALRETFVKRLIALPEDSVEVDSFGLRLNGAPVPRAHTGTDGDPFEARPLDLYEETLDGVRYVIAKQGTREVRLFPRTTVEPDRIFVMGDNRDNSRDSRFTGTIPASDVVGVVSHIYFSRDPEGGEIRWDRIGRVVK